MLTERSVEHFDVIVVGAGSSGGVLASRLSEDPSCTVALVEAGPDFPDERTQPPGFLAGGAFQAEGGAGSGAAVPELDWGYQSEPDSRGRRVRLSRGKLVGGTSMINGCIAVRGRPKDFSRWVEAGAEGWGWNDVLPFYEVVEREVPIKRYPRDQWLPFQRVGVDAFLELGYRWVDDMNEPDAWDRVAGPWPSNRRNEIRQGTLVTYIRKARGRPNLKIIDSTLVDRVLLEGSRATGIAAYGPDGQERVLKADVVYLCAGAYGSAPILLRSGVGPAADLRDLGIAVAADLPVGQGLMDHATCGFRLRTQPDVARLGGPGLASVARGTDWWAIPKPTDEEEGVCDMLFCLATTGGAGSVRLASTRLDAAPRIDNQYGLTAEGDGFDSAWAMFEALLQTRAFRDAGVRDGRGGESLHDILRARIGSSGHGAGGCSIGRVVDSDLNVYGFDCLRVADASVFPHHVTNNPNLTCYMVGEAAAARFQPAT
jgi:choline dehydrogenase